MEKKLSTIIRKENTGGVKYSPERLAFSMIGKQEFSELKADESTSEWVSGIDFFPLRPIGNAYGSSAVLSYEGLKTFYAQTRHLQTGLTVADTKIMDENRMRGKLTATELGLRKGISDGSTRLNIMSDGGIFAGGCVLYVPNLSREKVRLGFIQEEGYSIHNIWHNNEQLDSFRNQTSLASEKCDVCSEYKLKNCSGYVVEMDFFKKINKCNPHCKF